MRAASPFLQEPHGKWGARAQKRGFACAELLTLRRPSRGEKAKSAVSAFSKKYSIGAFAADGEETKHDKEIVRLYPLAMSRRYAANGVRLSKSVILERAEVFKSF